MFPTISSRKKKVVLARDDIEGIQFLYGSNPNFNGSTATLALERDTSDGSVPHLCGALVRRFRFVDICVLILGFSIIIYRRGMMLCTFY
ncbi:hypothetical protein glysoja_029180 [Glycine soja]|uniref:Transmembrane protein n=1 Tax=Glycine soja TaxID=3848 RepID=A0A0B2PNF4_GLYSO|nr:hypothetical protein glysoja_029180 [Glycine soja]